jgi:hypothetical protein
MGAEGSVTLQLREAVQAPVSESTTTTINNALTIGYPDPEILADVLGTFQAAGNDATYDIITDSGGSVGGRQQQTTQFFKAGNITTINKSDTGTFIHMHEQKCASLPLECMKNKIIKHKIFHK